MSNSVISNNPIRIIHIEDSDSDVELVDRELKKYGINFLKLVVYKKEDFIRNLEDFSPDIVLSDHSLPSFNSIEALKILRETGSTIPFILVTGTMSEEFAVEVMKMGISDYLLKSHLKRIPDAILKAIEKWELQRAKEKAEQDLIQINKELRNLSAHLQNIREEERASISRELHDELGQQLMRIKMDFIWLSSKIKDAGDEVKAKITDSIELVDQTVGTIRRIHTTLRPKIIDDLGLFAALEWQALEFTKRTEIPCFLKIDINEPALSKFLSIHIFRIYQEALTNVGKHAQAKEVNTELKFIDGNMIMSIQDDGKGINTEKMKNERSFGLLGMKERAAMINGTIRIQSSAGKGTTLELTIPVENLISSNDEFQSSYN